MIRSADKSDMDTKPLPFTTVLVKNLIVGITDGELFRNFIQAGHILARRIYQVDTNEAEALITYYFENQADQAINKFNNTILNQRIIAVLRSTARYICSQDYVGGLIIKDLPDGVNENEVSDKFKSYGEILFHYLAKDFNGRSKGYGFIFYKTVNNANLALKKSQNIDFKGLKVIVEKLRSPIETVYPNNDDTFTNIYIKYLPSYVDDAQLKETFDVFGPITKCGVAYDCNGISRQFAFVNYDNHESAVKAIEKMHNCKFGNTYLYVSKYQNKQERFNLLKINREQQNQEQETDFKYFMILGLNDNVTREMFDNEVKTFCNPVWATVIIENDVKLGYICYATPKDAEEAAWSILSYSPLNYFAQKIVNNFRAEFSSGNRNWLPIVVSGKFRMMSGIYYTAQSQLTYIPQYNATESWDLFQVLRSN